MNDNIINFNIYSFVSTFARSLIEIFISLYLFKSGYIINDIVLFYFFAHVFAIPLSYFYVKLGEKINYILVMIIGVIGFLILQLLLNNIIIDKFYLIMISLIYSIYRRGYWVSRRFYLTSIMPTNKSSSKVSIVMVVTQLALIISGYVGSIILSKSNMLVLTIISSLLLFLSLIPLMRIKYDKKKTEIKLIENIKKYDLRKCLVFSSYELNDVLTMLFPIYIAIYIDSSYSLIGVLSVISNIAIMIFILVYGRVINKDKNYLVLSTVLLIVFSILKLTITSKLILLMYFLTGLFSKMQNQSINKVYFEKRDDMDLTHYNLIYQIIECVARCVIMIPLFFMNNIRMMIFTVLIVMFILMIIYKISTKENNTNKLH